MTSVNLSNRSDDYRRRAKEARDKAATTGDPHTRDLLLHDADLWERMASWEDVHNPPRRVDLAWRS